MATVKLFGNCRIAIFFDHGPPHFHILGIDGADLSVDILTMKVRHGNGRKYKEALNWAADNRDLLVSVWKTLNPKG